MEKISKEEANGLVLLSNGREIWLTAKLKELPIGEGITLKRTEWKAKYPPTQVARKLEKKYNWKFRTGRLLDNSGWLLQRVS